ncbi:hypothetical protein [Brevundimonas viscosa]|uniref:DnrO protein n=1 Tax=Brevundimonas viscosa TaxID=871741 RepID=A0A1I6P4E9_9CAUL|nr:hypothetical protein [Brevundimonas viscosa]SFS35039.1 hypothetical protein SAMN05192570_0826 [Brevundimonas viscosa]
MSLRLIAAIALVSASLASPALAQHAHEAPAALALDHGQRWATDAPLRHAMETLRAGAPDTAPLELAALIDAQTAYIIDHCRLPPEADANLHLIIERLLEAAELLRAGEADAGRSGAIAALDAYGAHFDHPGWRPLRP